MFSHRFQYILKKAVATVCFFLFFAIQSYALDNLWQFDPALERIYKLILSLQIDQAKTELSQLKSANEFHKIYLESLLGTADILITEDEKRFNKINETIKTRVEKLSNMPETAETLFLQAELNLQRGFNLLNLGQELHAVLAIRQAYQATQSCLKKYPTFIPIKKTHGVIQVMVGAVPDKYQWFMSLLGMKGSVRVGQKQLEDLRTSNSSLSLEASILFYSIKGFLNQRFEEAAIGFQECRQKDPGSRLLLFLSINMLVKDSQSDAAYKLILELDKHPDGLPMVYVEYLRGEVLVQKGEYIHAIQAYQKFLKGYESQSFKKDSYYKISLCYYLMGDMVNANKNFETARSTGKTTSDPDRFAAAMLADNVFPNKKILRIRFYTDGGYYKEARETIQTVTPSDLVNPKDATEFYYRKGRLAHKTQDFPTAKTYYIQTIEKTGDSPWYFAPNAALQLGYISQAQGDLASAKKYFEKAISYKRHVYKSGIDSKAKFALDQLKNQ